MVPFVARHKGGSKLFVRLACAADHELNFLCTIEHIDPSGVGRKEIYKDRRRWGSSTACSAHSVPGKTQQVAGRTQPAWEMLLGRLASTSARSGSPNGRSTNQSLADVLGKARMARSARRALVTTYIGAALLWSTGALLMQRCLHQ